MQNEQDKTTAAPAPAPVRKARKARKSPPVRFESGWSVCLEKDGAPVQTHAEAVAACAALGFGGPDEPAPLHEYGGWLVGLCAKDRAVLRKTGLLERKTGPWTAVLELS